MSEDSIDIDSTTTLPTSSPPDSSTSSSNIFVTIIQEIFNIPVVFVFIYCYWICFLLSYVCSHGQGWGADLKCDKPITYGFDNNYVWYIPPFIFTAIIIWVGYELNLGIHVIGLVVAPIFLMIIWEYIKAYMNISSLQSRTISGNVVHE